MRAYLERLQQQGQVHVIDREVDPKFELSAVTDKVQRTDNKVVLFNRVKGTQFPVLTNIYGSRERLAQILGIKPGDFSRQWTKLTNLGTKVEGGYTRTVPPPSDLIDCKMSDLPLITYCEKDVGPYFTAAVFYAKEPETGVGNLSFHRSMVVSDKELRCRLAPRHHLTLYHEKAEKMGKHLECVMMFGPPPELFLAAAAPVPYDVDEVEVAAQLRGAPIEMRPCKWVDLMVPASTEMVIEGRFLPNERRPEGPFGEFMGYYVGVGNNAVFEVLGVSARPGGLFHSILSGSSEEVLSLELSIAANIFQRVNAVLPGIVDVTCNPFAFQTIVKIRQQYEGHARQVLLAVMGAELTWAKSVIVVDEDVDIYDIQDVVWAVLTRARPDQDTILIPGVPSFYRDPHKDHWGRIAVDACAPFARRHEYERKRVPGAREVKLEEYLGKRT
ncbi:MAG: UbiD family decarboxylase [Rhodospirillales bacterium]|nr:UbiD family decarboxylase [Rhodospirillales bacterium]